ncbi:MAG: B12-binding domain-containing radical SAM protein [Desulfuromonadales bacterium]|nr:B12-binding domain-containing radical SAM protein [Desulfuromonadales bacterium]
MNILFLTVPPPLRAGFSTNEKRPPLGVGYLMAVMKQQGHTIYFSDEYLKKTNILKNGFVVNKKIDVVALYLNTICYENGKKMIEELQALRQKKIWNGRIFVGGPHTSIGASNIPDYVDRIFIGESEISFSKVIAGELDGRIVQSLKVENLDSLPFPAWEEFIYRPYDWGHAWLEDTYPIYTFNTSRGCPYSCTFCSVNSIWGKSYRYMSAERIVNDIVYMQKKYGAKGIYFREDHFTLNKNRIIDFCNLLLKKNIKIDWMCESRADDICDKEYQQLMKNAGCKVFYVGVESGSPRILEKIKKDETIEDFITAFKLAKEVGIKTYASFVVGLPFEEKSDLDMTQSFIDNIDPDYICKNVYVGIPGSELYDYIDNNKLYEYKDINGIIYPIGYKKNVRKYYGSDYFEVYSSSFYDSLRLKSRNFLRRVVNFRIANLRRH